MDSDAPIVIFDANVSGCLNPRLFGAYRESSS